MQKRERVVGLAYTHTHTHTHTFLANAFEISFPFRPPKVKLVVIEVDGKTMHKLGDLVNAVCVGSYATVTVFRHISA